MSKSINITSKGIASVLKNYNEKQAVAEYIWNGFDANADLVRLNYKANGLGLIEELEICDNGYGINFSRLQQKFDPFFDSEKAIQITTPKHTSKMHGRNGVGRLTFFTFATNATWKTVYREGQDYHSGSIHISAGALNSYSTDTSPTTLSDLKTGTTVSFSNMKLFKESIEQSIIPFLISEFCWFIELNKQKGYRIEINGTPLDFSNNISTMDEFDIIHPETGTTFKVKYIQWNKALHKEFSKYYFLAAGEEVFKEYTSLNKKSDDYFHSVYIESDFFSNFDFKSIENGTQVSIFGAAKSSPEYRFLIKSIGKYIADQRKPFLREHAIKLIEEYEKDGILPSYKTEWEIRLRKPELTNVIKALYEAEPKLFSSLNNDQKKTFVRFLDLLLDSGERESIFSILNEVVDLEPQERSDLASILEYTRLNRITDTIKLLSQRYEIFYKLSDLVYNKDLSADEVNHLQKVIENHFWIFGEQYHLLTAAEPKFEEALRRYTHLLTEKDETVKIDHPHRLKEMDIFACRQNKLVDRIENIVIELKHPLINLGSAQYNQVYNYLDVIIKQAEFNAPNMFWEFHLIGNKFDRSDFLKNLISTNKPHGLRSLVLSLEEGRIKIFAKTWSEVFADFEIRHAHLDNMLKLEREKLFNKEVTAIETVASTKNMDRILPGNNLK